VTREQAEAVMKHLGGSRTGLSAPGIASLTKIVFDQGIPAPFREPFPATRRLPLAYLLIPNFRSSLLPRAREFGRGSNPTNWCQSHRS
jgi:hypothetical protein